MFSLSIFINVLVFQVIILLHSNLYEYTMFMLITLGFHNVKLPQGGSGNEMLDPYLVSYRECHGLVLWVTAGAGTGCEFATLTQPVPATRV